MPVPQNNITGQNSDRVSATPSFLYANQSENMRQACKKFGNSAFSFDMYEVPHEYQWFAYDGAHGTGGIAYKSKFGAAVIVGNPFLSPHDWEPALMALKKTLPRFTVLSAIFADPLFAEKALATGGAAIAAQQSVSLNPQEWDFTGPKRARIRQYVRKSARVGNEVKTYSGDLFCKEGCEPLKEKITNLVNDWKENSLKRHGSAHNENLWESAEEKTYFLLESPEGEYQAMVIARPVGDGYYLWPVRASHCLTGSLEALIYHVIGHFRTLGETRITFGPFQWATAHVYRDNGGTVVSRFVLTHIVPWVIKKVGYHKTASFYKKFDFPKGDISYNLIWPKRSWLRLYIAMEFLFA